MGHQPKQQVGVGSPAVAFAKRCVTGDTQRIAQHGDPHQAHRAGEVLYTVDLHEWAQGPSRCRKQSFDGLGCIDDGGTLADHEIGAAFETSRELRNDSRRIGEITLQQQHCVTTRIPRLP